MLLIVMLMAFLHLRCGKSDTFRLINIRYIIMILLWSGIYRRHSQQLSYSITISIYIHEQNLCMHIQSTIIFNSNVNHCRCSMNPYYPLQIWLAMYHKCNSTNIMSQYTTISDWLPPMYSVESFSSNPLIMGHLMSGNTDPFAQNMSPRWKN